MASVSAENPYLAHRDLIEHAIRQVCRRRRLPTIEAEDFASDVRLRLIDNDCAILRAFKGRSALHTYLLTVVTHRFQDWRNAQWGKWRPSAEARRLGPLAIRLETLIVRDRLTLDQAYESLAADHDLTESRADLEAMATRFPARTGRTLVSVEALPGEPAASSRADAEVVAARAVDTAAATRMALARALRSLPAEDRLILRMRFDDDIRVVDIARLLRREQKPLYRHLDRLLAQLREALEEAGVARSDVRDVIEHGGFDRLAELNSGESTLSVRHRTRRRGSMEGEIR